MDVVSACPLPVASVLWRTPKRGAVLTIVCKATYALLPVESSLAAEQDALHEGDRHRDDDPARELLVGSDLVPFKRRADVVLVGRAYAPRREPVRSLLARLIAGEVDKTIEVFGDRAFALDGQLGPIAPSSPGRALKLAHHAAGWDHARWSASPLPDDLDPAYFNEAPVDQQLDVIHPDLRIVLENLHPAYPRLVTNLVPVVPRATVSSAGHADEEPRFRCDTVWIDADRGICALTWRAQWPLERADQQGRVTVTLTPARDAEPAKRPAAGRASTLVLEPAPSAASAKAAPDDERTLTVPALVVVAPPLPFRVAPAIPEAQGAQRSDRTGLPFTSVGRPQEPVGSDSPWAATPPLPVPGDFRGGGGALLASNAAAGVSEARPAIPAPAPSLPALATAPVARAAPAREPEALDLLFFDADSLPRVRRVRAWRELIAALEDKPLDAEEDDPDADKEPGVVEDRREILEILLHGEPSDGAALDEALGRAAREDGRFLAPIVLIAGELATPFDEIETLKATVTAVTPLAGTDENLRASVAIAREFLQLPCLSSSPAMAEGLTTRVRDAFNQGKRAVQPGYLDAQTERALVEQRLYQHRRVLGGRRQRALLHVFDRGVTSGALPAASRAEGSPRSPLLVTYLPDTVADRLPLAARFRVRILARVHLSVDPYEQGTLALEVLALARLVTPPRRGP